MIPSNDPEAQQEVEELNGELDALHLEGHWRLVGAADPEPTPTVPPHLWRWTDIRRLLLKAGEMRGIEGGAGRRTVRLCMPGLREKWATRTIHASFQLVKPGEIAEAHRHSMGALRFVVEGEGGFTNVEGEKFGMSAGDLILTPQWTWHDHGNEGNGPMIWLDGHDGPLTLSLNAMFFERLETSCQRVTHDDLYTSRRSGAMRPRSLTNNPSGCPYVYKGRDALALLHAMEEDEWDPFDGFLLDYVNPLTGGSTLPTIACRLQRLPHGRATKAQRSTASLIYQIVSGSGRTIAGSETLRWQTGDAFVIPGWTWYEHMSDSSDDAVLFSMSDEPVMRALSLLKEERAGANG